MALHLLSLSQHCNTHPLHRGNYPRALFYMNGVGIPARMLLKDARFMCGYIYQLTPHHNLVEGNAHER
jgi:hypothetical protein